MPLTPLPIPVDPKPVSRRAPAAWTFGGFAWLVFIVGLHACVLYDLAHYRSTGTLFVFARPLKEVFGPLIFLSLFAAGMEDVMARSKAKMRGQPRPRALPMTLPQSPWALLRSLVSNIALCCAAFAIFELAIQWLTGRPFLQQIMGPLGWAASIAVFACYVTLWLYLSAALLRGLDWVGNRLSGAN